MFKSIIETMISGGPVMIPIIIVSLIVWTLIIEKWHRLKAENIDADGFTEKVARFLKEEKKNEAMDLCVTTSGIVPRAINALLSSAEAVSRSHPDKTKMKQSLLKPVHEVLLEEYPGLEQHLSTISTLVSVSPLLGLLGTVTGMVSTFTSITLHGTGDPQALARGISEALITTQSGLIVAIPALFFYNYLTKKVDNIMSGLEKSVVKIINILTRESK